MLGILGAMDLEVAAIRSSLDGPATRTVLGSAVVSGLLDGTPLLLVQCGIGKVNAALATAALVQAGADTIVVTGVGGGLGPDVRIGDLVLATDLVQHDIDLRPFGRPLGQLPGSPLSWPADPGLVDRIARAALGLDVTMHRGRIASGDQFIDSALRSDQIRDEFGAIAVEMEGAAVAQAATQLGVRFAVLRWISDTADSDATTDFDRFCEQAGVLDLAIVRALVAM